MRIELAGAIRGLTLVAGMLFTLPAYAASVVAVTPQGEVAQVRQVTVKFSAGVVPFGDPKLTDPFAVTCQGAAPAGSGRWANDRTWLFDFREPLGPGVRCDVTVRADWKPQISATSGAASGAGSGVAAAPTTTPTLTGATRFSFSTGGPAVVTIDPYAGGQVEEDQHFLLRLNGAAVETSVAANAWCEVEGIGERLPLRVITGALREQLLKARRIDVDKDKLRAAKTLIARCDRPLPNGSAMRIVWGRGIAAAANPKVVTTVEQRFRYTVRPAFTAEFSCERERANAPCLPIRPMTVRFTAKVAREQAARARLVPAQGEALAPVFDKDDKSVETNEVTFARVLAENANYTVTLPSGLVDNAGRVLANASAFPLKVKTGAAPPIAKFAAAPFGIVERHADAMLPVTLRHVQGDLRPSGGAAGQVRVRRLQGDGDILAWYAKLQRYHETQLSARELGLPEREWTTTVDETDSKGRIVKRRVEKMVGTREISLLANESGATELELPQLEGGDPRPFEVVGIPLAGPGYHVVEIESLRLGQSLLDKRAPMYVRTGVLLTNLGVHFKHGRENSVVWVTTLDRGTPVAGADVAVNDCNGKPLWNGRTDAKGLAVIARALDASFARCIADPGYFVTARKALDGDGAPDVAFVFSGWQKGIEPWRFQVPTARGPDPEVRASTVFDRPLFRAGETVSMKHFVRLETSRGLAPMPRDRLPTRVKLVHQGSGQEFVFPLAWRGDGRNALTTWPIPPAARLGVYEVVLERETGDGAAGANTRAEDDNERRRTWPSGSFRVEEFRLPLVDARLSPPAGTLVAPSSVAVAVQMAYFSGGAMGNAPLRASALLKTLAPSFAGYDEFSFEPPRDPKAIAQEAGDNEDGERDASTARDGRLVADKVPLVTDRNGAATFTLANLPAVTQPSRIDAEVTFNDPNGETQTVATQMALWPSAVVVGIRSGSWASNRGRAKWSVVALDTNGKPIKGQAVAVVGRVSQTISTRKRLVGGFYAYDNRTEVKDLGKLCSGSTDQRGLLPCEASLEVAGQVELIAEAKDKEGHVAQAAASVWITKQGELWFAQDNDDRIDVLPEKKRYEPGETARLQVRMPYREATALVAVEREGVIATQVVTLRGDDPTVELKIEPTWGPNVYVSVLALRGRIRETPWYSFFTWGWKEPLAWWRSFRYDGKDYQPPTAMVDLAKPSFKLGVAAFRVGLAAHQLQVSVSADKPVYQVRQKALAKVKVAYAGKPLAGAEIAFAAVDDGLLALRANDSWQLLDSMLRERAWGVETSTAQSEIVGRRHYGRKAIAAGGGGGRGATRELFDTLLVWKGVVALDGNGEATIEVPLNDSLTSFTLVAIADSADDGVPRFGTGKTSIRVTQDLQVLAGLPPLVREGDRFAAMLTLRNTTAREMKVRASLQGMANAPALGVSPIGAAGSGASAASVSSGSSVASMPAGPSVGSTGAGAPAASASTSPSVGSASIAASAVAGDAAFAIVRTRIDLPAQDVVLAAGSARELVWPVNVPLDAFSIVWEAAVDEAGGAAGAARDRLKVTQLVGSAVPVRVVQATLVQLDGDFKLMVAAPLDALPPSGAKRGGVDVAVQPRLTSALPGMRRFFETYPFICLEQKISKAVGLKDARLWTTVVGALPTYLDSDGLASYFPPRADEGAHGSDRLTAYLLAATNEAGFELPAPARDAMLGGLAAFVEGRIERKFWSPRADLDVRKIAAIEALSRYGRAEPRMLGSINVVANTWPTAAVIDWLRILRKVEGIPERKKRLDEAQQILRGRLTYAGTTLKFSTEESDFWWWLMDSADANAARLILAVLDDPAWRDDLPRMVVGSLARQRRGAWLTTTANLWGSLALDKFSARFESEPVAGRTVASFATAGAGTAGAASTAGGAGEAGAAGTASTAGTAGTTGTAGAAGAAGAAGKASPTGAAGAAGKASPTGAAVTATRPVADWSKQSIGGAVRLAWPAGSATLDVAQEGSGKPWLTVQSLAAIELKAPLAAGYRVSRSVSVVEQKDNQGWSRGDIVRVRLEIDAQSDMTWVVVSDPVPAGATILGSGLGRDSQIATRTEQRRGSAWPAFEERSFEAYRGYYEFMPKGKHVVEYSVRLNNPGRFSLPPTRVEAMYAPESFGEAPNAAVEVAP